MMVAARRTSSSLLGHPSALVDDADTPTYPDLGLMFGYQKMPATFTPGAVEGAHSST
jgi:hypothetical protein